jgi:hypothetical protein
MATASSLLPPLIPSAKLSRTLDAVSLISGFFANPFCDSLLKYRYGLPNVACSPRIFL